MKATICDFCKQPIKTDVFPVFSLTIKRSDMDDTVVLDMCGECEVSPVILSESSRTRTRKPKAKVGRPRGSRTQKTNNSQPQAEVVNG